MATVTAMRAGVSESATTRRLSLAGAARVFAGYGSPRIIFVFALATVGVRIPLGHWSLADLAVFGGILAAEPFVEWVLHVFLLHFKPRRLFGRKLDPLFARRHRMHHRDPRNIPLVFVPLPVLAGLLGILFAIAWFAFATRQQTFTAFATFTWFLLGYEWTHFLIHSPYVPRTALFRAIWRAHILHHYKNEKYWFGVTNPIADHVLRTFPAKDSVETSPTARTLGVDDELTLIGARAATA
jgi:hypothetical protein